jgi:Holliday junction resolvase-like predicted endonuclease
MQHLFSKTMKGQHSEFTAAAWLIKQNYLVYIKTQDNDPIDLVAVHRDNGKVQKFDVKSVSIRKTGRVGDRINRVLNKHQKKIGVKLLYVYDDGRCDFHGKD